MLYRHHICNDEGMALGMAQQEWIIDYYVKRNGQCPTKDFLDSLTDEELTRLHRKIQWLKKSGNALGPPYTKFLRDHIWELRVRSRRKQLRILYFFCVGRTIVFTHGFVKRSGPVADSEIDRAVEYREDYLAEQEGRQDEA